jgi:mRNA-degrading endonuclease YafQ of YafQ-DinJ toxin-antitoxin module
MAKEVRFLKCDLYKRTFEEKITTDALAKKVQDFLIAKHSNPLAAFNKSDQMFSAQGAPLAQKLPSGEKIRHAHITQDISIVYTLSGGDTKLIKLFGFFTHAELGTQKTPSIPTQRSKFQQFSNLSFDSGEELPGGTPTTTPSIPPQNKPSKRKR